jgi:hypothetical protein
MNRWNGIFENAVVCNSDVRKLNPDSRKINTTAMYLAVICGYKYLIPMVGLHLASNIASKINNTNSFSK